MPYLARRFPSLDGDQVRMAATDGVLDYLHRIGSREAADHTERRRLILGAAYRNCLDILDSERARKQRERAWWDDTYGGTAGARAVFPVSIRPQTADLIAGVEAAMPDRRMCETFRIWLEGERGVHSYAEALGVDGLPSADQRVIVLREKDRLRKFLRRDTRAHAIACVFFDRES